MWAPYNICCFAILTAYSVQPSGLNHMLYIVNENIGKDKKMNTGSRVGVKGIKTKWEGKQVFFVFVLFLSVSTSQRRSHLKF